MICFILTTENYQSFTLFSTDWWCYGHKVGGSTVAYTKDDDVVANIHVVALNFVTIIILLFIRIKTKNKK